jgi:hypothetical protein
LLLSQIGFAELAAARVDAQIWAPLKRSVATVHNRSRTAFRDPQPLSRAA